ncbi:MAG: hypothetical protein ACTSRA_18065, partial [Promethearchaeota archaeon]
MTGKRKISSILILVLFVGIIIFSFIAMFSPAFYGPERRAQIEMLNTPGSRKIFTTYFYWYRSGGQDFSNSPHCMEYWNNDVIDKVNQMSGNYPADWPGPRTPEAMMVNITENGGWHDSLTHHPPATKPEYNETGDISGNLTFGLRENLTSWFDWMNPEWHEWEIRCMIRAGIDVLMPVYWWNGVHNYWALEGLQTLVTSWHDLAAKVTAEANYLDNGNRT